MCMELLNDVVIQCEECGNIIVIKKEYLDAETSSYERQMGPEIVYDIYEECDCEECGNNIKYRISGYEYPVGCFNYEDNEIHGGQFLEKPNMGIVYQVEFDEESIASFLPQVEENINRILNDKRSVYQLTPREFEEVVEEVFKRQGFQTRLTPQTRDGGKDIIATKSILGRPVMFLIECKRYNEMNKIGVDIVRALYGVQTAERANKAIIVTSSYFTEDAQRFAEQQKTLIDLFDIDDLIRLMENSIQNEQGNF